MTNLERICDKLIKKREACYNASGFTSITSSNHACTILKDGVPIIQGMNVYNLNGVSTEHAEAQALRKYAEKIGKRTTVKKQTIDLLIVRTNGGNSKPCDRCINDMLSYSSYFNIRNIYYTHHDEPSGIRCVKFSKLITEERHYCSYDRNLRRNMRRNSF